jgi:YVTN family beta-propeller protein
MRHPCAASALLALVALLATTAPAAERIYVTNERSGELSVVDGATHEVVATLPLGKRPRGMDLSPDGKRLYVALSGSPIGGPHVDESTLPPADKAADGIGVVELAGLRLVRTLRGVSDPEQVAVGRDGRKLYIASEDTATAVVIDEHDGRLLATLPVGVEPEGIAVSPDGRWVYVTAEADDVVTVIDTREDAVVATVPVGARPRTVLFARDAPRAYVSCENDATVAVIDTRTHRLERKLAVPGEGARPMGLALAPGGDVLYVSTGRGRHLVAFDARAGSVIGSVEVGPRPWGVAASRDGRYVYTANGPSNDVTVVDARTLQVVKRIPVGTSPWGVLAHQGDAAGKLPVHRPSR